MRVSGMHRLLFGAVIGVTGMALAVPASTLGAGAASTVKVYAPGTVGIVAPTTGPTAGSLGQTATHSSRGARALPHATSNSPAAAAVPNVSGITPAVASSLLANFNGTSSNDSRKTNFNQEFEPPDQGLCVGNGYVLEPVNSAYRIFKTDGKTPGRSDQRQRSLRPGIHPVHQRPALLLRPQDQHVVRDDPLPQRR